LDHIEHLPGPHPLENAPDHLERDHEPAESCRGPAVEIVPEQGHDLMAGRHQRVRCQVHDPSHTAESVVGHVGDPEDSHTYLGGNAAGATPGSCPNRHKRSAIWRVHLPIPQKRLSPIRMDIKIRSEFASVTRTEASSVKPRTLRQSVLVNTGSFLTD